MTTFPTDHKEIALPQGTIRYRDLGDPEGEPLVFVHGLLVDGRLWDTVAENLAGRGLRCVVPDWPMGSHRIAMNEDADLGGYGMAGIVAGFIRATGIGRATLVGNDSGGAISQIAATEHPDAVSGLILTNCDTFEEFPPSLFTYLVWAAKIPGAIFALAQGMRIPAVRRTPLAYGVLTKSRIEGDLLSHWVKPLITDRDVRRDGARFIRGISPKQTMKAAEKLAGFEGPVRFAWAREDKYFKLSDAERLAAIAPDSAIETVGDAKTFVTLDQPGWAADTIAGFMGAGAAKAGGSVEVGG